MTNKDKLLQQIIEVDNETLLNVGAFKQIHGAAFNGQELDFDFLDKVSNAYKQKGIEDFDQQFNQYLDNFEHKESETTRNAAKGVVSKSEKIRATTKNGEIVPTNPPANLNPITASELDKKNIKPIEWLVNEILPFGLLLLSAPPKNFKSYMALQLCTTICLGGRFLDFDCNKHACLYLDLESTERRPKNRLNQILGKDTPKPDNLYIVTGEREVKRIGDGFETQIKQQLEEHPDIKLVIVDVYQLIALPKKGNQNAYDKDYESLRALKKIVDTYNIGIMLIHHNRKMKDGGDVFNEVSGSIAMTGSMDATWIIQKDRRSKEATLNITGRDLEQRELKIKFNTDTYKWEYMGTAEDIEFQRLQFEYEQSPITETVKKLLHQNNGYWEGAADDIKKASKYLSWEIDDAPQKIGKLVMKYQGLFFADRINVDKCRKSGKRLFLFKDLNVINVTNDTNVINVTNDTKQ